MAINQTDSLESLLAVARDEIAKLRTDLRAAERHGARLLEMFEEQQLQLNNQQSKLVYLDRVLSDVVTGRVWRTLRAVGGVVKKVIPGQPPPQTLAEPANNGEPPLKTAKGSRLVCDEPIADIDRRPRSGSIVVRGWAIAPGGVDSVTIEIPGLPLIETKICIPRPDVQKSFPDLDTTGRAGFSAQFDSLILPKGRHAIMLRAIAAGIVIHETRTFVDIDHEKGFVSDYQRWISEFERPEAKVIDLKVSSFAFQPLISLVMPAYNTKPDELTDALESVLAQSYANWELCIADDQSTNPEVREILTRYSARDARVKVVFQPERGGISRATNAALRLTTGEFVALLDHDDTLAMHALAYVCEAINQNPHSDLFYSDEDKLDERGIRYDPFFKPDWSPDLLLSENYICHLLVLRRDLAQKAGGLNPEFDGSQDYDLVLRATALAARIHHIPKVLYHWRAGETSTASTIANKSYAIEAARKALAQACERAGEGATVEPGFNGLRWRVRYPIAEDQKVSIVIPSGGKVEVLRTNLDSLFSKTTYRNYEVVIVDNSKGIAIEKLAKEYPATRYLDARNQPFNFSAINNAAAKQCHTPLLLFLNDDTSVIAPGWLEALVELAVRPEVGAVGAKLLYPNGVIQHAGVVLGVFDNCGHAFKGLDGAHGHYFDLSDVIRNVSAVTGACLMTRADVFEKVGGFDETQFAVAFNDIDLCLKMGSFGYRVLYTPHALLYHHESLSKTSKDLIPHPEEVAAMRSKWGAIIAHDPFYSPNLTRNEEDYSLRTRT